MRPTRTQRHIEQFRQGTACFEVRDNADRQCAGVAVSVEQERHEFPFGCVMPDLKPGVDEKRLGRLSEVFNCLGAAGVLSDSSERLLVQERIPLGQLRHELDQFGAANRRLRIHVWGAAVGLSENTLSQLAEREAGKRAAELYTLCFAHPAVAGIHWNGCVDGDPDVRGGGLLRADLAPKYAYKVLRKLIGMVWHTRASGITDPDGRFRFRGFLGDYRVVVYAARPNAHVECIRLSPGSPVSPIGIRCPKD